MPKNLPQLIVILHLSTIGYTSSNVSATLRKTISPPILALNCEGAVSPELQTHINNPDGQESADVATRHLVVLNRLAKDALVEDKRFLGRPRFRVSLTKRTYWYDLNPVPLGDVLSSDDVYAMPLEALIRIKAL